MSFFSKRKSGIRKVTGTAMAGLSLGLGGISLFYLGFHMVTLPVYILMTIFVVMIMIPVPRLVQLVLTALAITTAVVVFLFYAAEEWEFFSRLYYWSDTPLGNAVHSSGAQSWRITTSLLLPITSVVAIKLAVYNKGGMM